MGITLTSNFDVNAALPLDSRMVVADLTARDAIAAGRRFQGMCVYVVADTITYQLKGGILNADWVELGSGTLGGSGAINLITNGNADNAPASIFTPYQNAAQNRPVDGVGPGSLVTTSLTTATPLSGTKSFLLTKPATNCQGQGWTVLNQSLPLEYRAKSLKVAVSYIVNSGTFVAGNNSNTPLDGDIIWYFYDITNSKLVEPSNIKMFSNSSTISDKFEATVQFDYNCTAFRLIAHCATTSAVAYEIQVDNFNVGPSQYVYGTPITDWKDLPNTSAGVLLKATTTSPTYGTIVTNKAMYRRVGGNLEIEWDYHQSTVGTAGVGLYLIDISQLGLSIDTSMKKITTTGTISGASDSSVGTFNYADGSNSAVGMGILSVYSSTQLKATFPYVAASSGNGVWSSYYAHTATSSDLGWSIRASIPILGWSSSVQMSDSADTRVVAAKYKVSGVKSYSATVPLNYDTLVYDTHGCVTPSATNWKFTSKTASWYRVSVVYIDPAAPTSLGIYINNTLTDYLCTVLTATAPSSGYGEVYLKSGDFLDIRSNAATSLNNTAYTTFNSVMISSIQGPQAIAASETMSLRYCSSAAQSLPSGNNTLSFATKNHDTHGLWNGTTFTAQIAGKYAIKVVTSNPASNAGLSGNVLRIIKNGSSIAEKYYTNTYVNTANYTYDLTDELDLIAGNTISFQFYNGFGATTTAIANNTNNFMSISKI